MTLGIAVRWWSLGIQKRPLFHRSLNWGWPLFAGIGGSFGYWMTGVNDRQEKLLADRRESLLEKRRRRAERESLVEKPEESGVMPGIS